jgi:replicative DNA helicase
MIEICKDAERIILSSMMEDPKLAQSLRGKLKAEDFQDVSHRRIYAAIAQAEGLTLDPHTLWHLCSKDGVSDGILELAVSLVASPTTQNPNLFVEALLARAKARKLGDLGREMVLSPTSEVLGYQKRLEEICAEYVPFKGSYAHSDFGRFIEMLEDERPLGIKTGFSELERLMGGWHRGRLHVIAARPGVGKTAFGITSMVHSLRGDNPHRVCFFSIEMSYFEIMKRIVSVISGLPHSRFEDETLGDLAVDAIYQTSAKLENRQYVVNTNKVGLEEIHQQILSAKRSFGGLDLVFVDFLQIMKTNKELGTREREIAEVSEGLKDLAKKHDVAVVAMAQINREVSKRTNKRPQLSDLRESGSIEQDADFVGFLTRDAIDNPQDRNIDPSQARLIVGKNRHGPTGDFQLRYRYECMRFEDG